MGLRVEEDCLPRGMNGYYCDALGLIVLHDKLNARQRLCTLQHELIHAHYHDIGCGSIAGLKAELRARRETALTLISPIILEPILKLKIDILGSRSSVLKVDDVLAALSITAATNTLTARAMAALPKLRDCEMHSTCMLHSGDEGTLRKMGLRLTSEPEYPSKDLFF